MRSTPDYNHVTTAASRLAGHTVVTPLLESDAVNRLLGGRLLLKIEALQHAGSFKFRGAYNRLLDLTRTEREKGVVAFSSGNHAQGVAAAARLLGTSATIVMPSDAPAIKATSTRDYGAHIIFYDRYRENREAIAARTAAQRGATLVPSYEDIRIIAGQGTVGLEMVEQAHAHGTTFDEVLVPCGGGGLIAGCSLAFRQLSPSTSIYAAEPADLNDHERSLALGRRVRNDPSARSFCDALLAPEPGDLTFEINQQMLSGGVSVPDADVTRAMAFSFRHFRVVLEPGGAVALACVLAGRRPIEGRTVGVVCSGGNVEPAVFTAALRSETVVAGGKEKAELST